MTLRQQEINAWLSSLFPNADLSNLQYLQSDASQRKYLRLQIADTSYVIMDTKPDQELTNFIQIAKILCTHKITAPEIIHCNTAKGLLLMSDFGGETYQNALLNSPTERIDSLYLDAITSLVKIQLIDTKDDLGYTFKNMDAEYLQVRMEVFNTWYLQKHLGMSVDATTTEIINKMQKLFTNVFEQIPHALVHVDYHCRNLMALPNNNPGVLDFQDAMIGPITYDLVSLFQDAYISWPRSQVEAWVNTYKDIAIAAGIIQPISSADLLRSFDLVGLQRHIKNLGVFARLHHRDGKSNYLNDMPMLMKYIQETCSRYSELNWLLEFITEEVQG